jgi:ribulose-phosphate 3-epimerase
MEPKIAEVRQMISSANLDDKVNVEVDGGISAETVSGAAKSGANILIAGSALFRDPKGLTHAVQQIRETATSAFNSR